MAVASQSPPPLSYWFTLSTRGHAVRLLVSFVDCDVEGDLLTEDSHVQTCGLVELALLPRLLSALPPLLSSRPSLPQAALLYLALTSALLAGASAAHALLKPDLTLPPPAVPRAPAAPPPLPPPPPQPPQQLR